MSYQRIACLSTEAVETLYLLGAEDRVAGISGFTVRPPKARKEKPKISGFSTARIDRILAVNPDLVVAFSDLQADIVRDLVRAGVGVHVFNQRDVAGIFCMIRSLAALVGKSDEGAELIAQLQRRIETTREKAERQGQRPRVYFEEWNDPLISGIRWVSELIDIAGGEDCFAELSHQKNAKDRIIAEPAEVIRQAPDIIVGSWCGKKFRPEEVRKRPGWQAIPAVRDNQLFEIKSPDILAPGPGAITAGLAQLASIIEQWGNREG